MKQVTSARGQNTQMGGSDPTLCGFQPPKMPWDRSRPSRSLRDRVLAACKSWSKHFVMRAVIHLERGKEEQGVALLRAPSKQPKTTTLQIRLEEEVRHNLDRYAEFIDANPSYVVSEALKLLFKKDDEFKRWADQHTNNHNQAEPQGGALSKTA
jgi:hypothetical protein